MSNLLDRVSQYRKELEQLIQAKEYSNILIETDKLLEEISQKEITQDNRLASDLNESESEEKFHILSDLSPAGICILTVDKYFYVNNAWCELTEYTVEESKIIRPLDTVHPEMKDLVKSRAEERFSGEDVPLRYDIKIVTKSGKVKWIDISFTIIKYEGSFAILAIMSDITDMKKFQEELIHSEEKFRKLSELSPSAVSIQRGNQYFYVNQAWTEITGYSENEIKRIGPYDIIHQEMRDYVKDLSNAELRNERAKIRYNLKIITKDKRIKWLDVSVTTIRYENKNASFAISNDITDVRRIQQDLIDKEKKYRSLIENLKHEYFFYRHNTNGVFEYVSPSIKSILGFEQNDFLKHYAEYFTDNPINEIARQKTELAMQGIQQLPYELEIYDIQKNIHTLEISETPIIDTDANVLAVEGIAHDITSQKKAEKIIQDQLEEIKINNEEIKSTNEELNAINDDLEARIKEIDILNKELKFSKTKYETLVKNIPGIVFRCRIDIEWTMEYMSDRVEDLTGYKASDFILSNTRSYTSIIHPDDRDKVQEIINKEIEKNSSYSIEYRLVNSKDEIVWVYELGQLFFKGKKKLLNGVVFNVTEKKKVEQKLVESEKELRKLNAQKDKFFSLLAHDLRSPVGNFVQISELLKTNYESLSNEEVIQFFNGLHSIADSTYKLLDNLLTWSRSQLDKLEIKVIEIKLFDLVNDVVFLFEENFKAKNIHFINELPRDIVVRADYNILQTLFRNLISNAIKFSYPEGNIRIKLKKEIENSTNKEYFIISVEDSGVGIPEDKIDKIFSFEEHYTTLGTDKEKGTGLGLNLCKELIEKMGEKIWLGSQEGKGTTFYFTLGR